jgi:site-specific recombinase XerC
MNQLVRIDTSSLPALVTAAGNRAEIRFLEFFAGQIRNPHMRAPIAAVGEFLTWCSAAGVQPVHVATWIEAQTQSGLTAPTVKQQLAAIRHLFDWLVTGQVAPLNPAGSVRGPSHIVKAGKTPALDPLEARALLDSIDA